jgi:hypothetical protein
MTNAEGMTNDECPMADDKRRVPRASGMSAGQAHPSAIRHSSFDIHSSFVISHSSFICH